MTDPGEIGFLSTVKLKRFHLDPDGEGPGETCVPRSRVYQLHCFSHSVEHRRCLLWLEVSGRGS